MVQWIYTAMPVRNASFEAPYQDQNGQFVAHGWRRWYHTGAPPREEPQGPCAEPEYKELEAARFPYRVTDGESAQCWFVSYKVMDGGLKQIVELPDPAPEFLQLETDAQAWCSNDNDPRKSEGEMYLSLGIDVYGREDPDELGVIWSPWWPVFAQYQRISGPVVKTYGNYVTIFLRAWNKWRFTHNDIIVDNLALQGITFEDEGDGEPPPPPPPGGVDYDEIEARMERQLRRLKLGLG